MDIWITVLQAYPLLQAKRKIIILACFLFINERCWIHNAKTIMLYISNARVILRKFSPSPISRAWDTHFIKSRIV